MPSTRTPSDAPDDATLYTWAEAIVTKRVDYFLSRRPPPPVTRDDQIQECLVHFWRQRSRYDPARGASLGTFLRHISDTRLLDLERGWRAARRGQGQRPASLDAPRGDDAAPMTLADRQRADVDVERTVLGELARTRLLARLSDLGQRLAQGLEAGHSMAELSRLLAVPRTTLRTELARIRRTLADER